MNTIHVAAVVATGGNLFVGFGWRSEAAKSRVMELIDNPSDAALRSVAAVVHELTKTLLFELTELRRDLKDYSVFPRLEPIIAAGIANVISSSEKEVPQIAASDKGTILSFVKRIENVREELGKLYAFSGQPERLAYLNRNDREEFVCTLFILGQALGKSMIVAKKQVV